jgi:thiol:disulfide interchange protein DsbD
MSLRRIWSIRGVVVAAGVVLTIGLIRWATPTPGVLAWQPFSIAALDAGLASGKPVVVDWTATWCINCRAVEAGVLDSARVQQAFRQQGAVLLRADITDHNPAAEALLAKLDGRAIPFLAIFSPEAPLQPTVLRDLYTRERVISELKQASRLSGPPLARR